MKRIARIILILLITSSIAIGIYISAFATTGSTEIIDINIYKAQCFAGVAEDSKSDAVERCNSLYNYYINEDIYSPSKSFLDDVYANDKLVADYMNGCFIRWLLNLVVLLI